jgi:Tfp pilus assembly protein PilO
MNSLFDKLNLRPQERRLVVIVAIIVFVVLNFWLVFPMFGKYGIYEQRARDARKKLNDYQQEIQKRPGYQKELKELQNQGGFVPTEQAALRLSEEINSQAALSGVQITSITPLQRQASGGKTNAFFEEATVTVNINSDETNLVDFLYRLADKNLLIRAKSMNIGPDPSRMRLQGPITLVKSYQRRPPPTKASTTTAASAAAKPAASPPAAKPTPTPAPPRNEPTVNPAPKPAAPPTTPPPATAPPSITNRVRRMPAPVKP